VLVRCNRRIEGVTPWNELIVLVLFDREVPAAYNDDRRVKALNDGGSRIIKM